MKYRIALLALLVTTILFAGNFSYAAAAPGEPNPNGRSWGTAVEGEPGAWRAHFALLGVEDGTGKLWGSTVSDFAQAGMMGGHASGK